MQKKPQSNDQEERQKNLDQEEIWNKKKEPRQKQKKPQSSSQ